MGTYHRGLTEFQGYPLAVSTSPDSPGHAGAARNSDRHLMRSQTATMGSARGGEQRK